MIPVYQLSRQGLWLLLLAQILLFLPHYAIAPVWLYFFYAIALGWRYGVFSGRLGFPSKSIKLVLLMVFLAGIVISFGKPFALDSLVSMLLGLSSLKLLEMYHKRDALVWVFLSIFVLMTVFLFNQNMLLAIYVFAVLCLLLAVYISFYSTSSENDKPAEGAFRLLRLSSTMVLQAIPLMIVMFVVFPRLGSLWSVPLQTNSARTGMSDTLSPGDINNLTQSREVAFRVTFDGDIPPNELLYWRGLVLNYFDGRMWEQRSTGYMENQVVWYGEKKGFMDDRIERGAPYANYQVIIEPTYTHWLYSLSTPLPRSANVGLTADFRLIKDTPVNSRFRYKARSFKPLALEAGMNFRRFEIETALPEEGNPRTRAWVKEMQQRYPDPQEFASAMLGYFNDSFFYTLKPPLLGEHSIDEFLFDTKKGYCEHFASSFAFVMRAAGIPARVIAGYQGGEINPYENYLLVHQYDAHAWVEVWFPGVGWHQIDPTASVAPQRILDGFRGTFMNGSVLEQPFSLDSYRSIGWLNQLRLQTDRVNYLWVSWVLGYDNKSQQRFLTRLLGEYSVKRIALSAIGFFAVFFTLLSLYVYWQGIDRNRSPVVLTYLRFVRKCERRGLRRKQGESPLLFCKRAEKVFSDSAAEIHSIAAIFCELAYRGDLVPETPLYKSRLKELKARISRLRLSGVQNGARQHSTS